MLGESITTGPDFLAGLDAIVTILVGCTALGAAIVGYAKWAKPKLQARQKRQEAFESAILGRPAVPHPEIPGKILAPAVPGIGERQARQEEQMTELVSAVAKIADTHVRVDALETRVTALEDGRVFERAAGKIESIQLMRTMEAAVNAAPNGDDDDRDGSGGE